jgi:hypothetical protein
VQRGRRDHHTIHTRSRPRLHGTSLQHARKRPVHPEAPLAPARLVHSPVPTDRSDATDGDLHCVVTDCLCTHKKQMGPDRPGPRRNQACSWQPWSGSRRP